MSMVKNVIISSLASVVFIAGISCASASGSDADHDSQGSAGAQEGSHQLVSHMTPASDMTGTSMKSVSKRFMITYLQLTSANPKVVSNAECMAYSGQTAVMDRDPNATETVGNNVVLKNYKAGRSYIGHNFSRNMWSADFTYTAKSGKAYHSRAYGEELLVKGMNVAYGSFINGYCEGYYKKTF